MKTRMLIVFGTAQARSVWARNLFMTGDVEVTQDRIITDDVVIDLAVANIDSFGMDRLRGGRWDLISVDDSVGRAGPPPGLYELLATRARP